MAKKAQKSAARSVSTPARSVARKRARAATRKPRQSDAKRQTIPDAAAKKPPKDAIKEAEAAGTVVQKRMQDASKKASSKPLKAPISGPGDSTSSRIVLRPAIRVLAPAGRAAALVLLSPFRFPVDHEHLAMQTARYAGTFFVVIGAIFTLINMQYASGITPDPYAQPAALISSYGYSVTVSGAQDANNAYNGTVTFHFNVPTNGSASNVAWYVDLGGGHYTPTRNVSLTPGSGGTDTWDSTTASDGPYTVYAKYSDNYGNATGLISKAFSVNNGNTVATAPAGAPTVLALSQKGTEDDPIAGSVYFKFIDYSSSFTGLTHIKILNSAGQIVAKPTDRSLKTSADLAYPYATVQWTPVESNYNGTYTIMAIFISDSSSKTYDISKSVNIDNGPLYDPPSTSFTCSIAASPASITAGDPTKLSWTTSVQLSSTDFAGATINGKALTYTQFSAGSVTVTPATSTAYAMHIDHTSGSSADCAADVSVAAPSVVKKPVTFSVDPSGTTLSGTVMVTAAVSDATAVALLAGTPGSALTKIGDATLVAGSNNWQSVWNTSGGSFPDGTYQLRARVTNPTGTYTQTDAATYTIANMPSTASTAPTNNSPLPTSITNTNTASHIDLEISNPLSVIGTIAMHLTTDGAAIVTVNARNTDSNVVYALGNATQVSASGWTYKWDSTNYPNGTYDVYATAQGTASSYASDHRTVLIANTIVKPTEDPAKADATLEPDITFTIDSSGTVSGQVSLTAMVSGATDVEMYAVNRYSLVSRYLGTASLAGPSTWEYDWDTTQIPNGDYRVYAQVTNQYGTYTSDKQLVTVSNRVVSNYTDKQVDTITLLQKTSDIVEKASVSRSTASSTPPQPKETPEERALREKAESILEAYRGKLDEQLQLYAVALRGGDPTQIATVEAHIDALKKTILAAVSANDGGGTDLSKLLNAVATLFDTRVQDTKDQEVVLEQRVGKDVFKDSDGDGISDYDEVNLYHTDPFNPDTDGDGYMDGTEIFNGFNPLDPRAEAVVGYESPQQTGITRPDILSVDSVTNVEPKKNATTTTEKQPKAIFSGRGLPNAFLTLYIFSTPVVVTVKTDDNGRWSYEFDKQLTDGTHEVYVGVTDNLGHIVAKSDPLTFVKTAQAFEPVDASGAAVISPPDTGPSFISQNYILVVSSLGVVALGLVLILLGFHMRNRQLEREFSARVAVQ